MRLVLSVLLLALAVGCGGPSEPAAEPETSSSAGAEPEAEGPAPEPPPASAVARVSLEEATIEGRSPPDEYAELIRSTTEPPLTNIAACYRERLGDVPGLVGALRLRLWVSAREVIRVTVEEPLDDEALQACAVEQIYAIELPDEVPTAGATVRFVLRFARGPREEPADPEVVVLEVES